MNADQLKALLEYDEISGLFRWRVRSSPRVRIGDIAGGCNDRGYVLIRVNLVSYKAHRLAWLYVYGTFPAAGLQIDHIDGNRANNRIANLRVVTNGQNRQNMRKPWARSGLLGAFWDSRDRIWVSCIEVDGKITRLGRFDTALEAHRAYMAKKAELHPFADMCAGNN